MRTTAICRRKISGMSDANALTYRSLSSDGLFLLQSCDLEEVVSAARWYITQREKVLQSIVEYTHTHFFFLVPFWVLQTFAAFVYQSRAKGCFHEDGDLLSTMHTGFLF